MAELDIIKYLRQKTPNGFNNITYLGAEQRFVSPLRNSGVNNLEEQYIIGTDTYSESYENDNGDVITVTEYHINTVDSQYDNFYRLVSTEYKEPIVKEKYYFEGDAVNLPDTDAIDVVDTQTSLELKDKKVFYITNTDNLRISPASFMTVKEDKLYFVRTAETDLQSEDSILILTKYTDKRLLDDGAGKVRTIIKESIINHFNQ